MKKKKIKIKKNLAAGFHKEIALQLCPHPCNYTYMPAHEKPEIKKEKGISAGYKK